MTRKWTKSCLSLLACFALLFSMAGTAAFAKAAGKDDHNYQLRDGVYMGFEQKSFEGYDFVGKLTVDTTKYTGFEVDKFSVSYTLRDTVVDLGTYPSDAWDIRVDAVTNGYETIRFVVTLFDKAGNSRVVESSFDLRQFQDSGIHFSDPQIPDGPGGGNSEIMIQYGSYYYGYMTYTYNGYTYDVGGRPGGSGCFPLNIYNPAPGSVLEIKVILSDGNGGSCEVIRTYEF